ncbi:hypothetical protein BIS47_178 [Klebsiella phage vB_KpnM_BIS47]|uniref:Uncharacterized protein n=1 Tax=Klebsiella phage vB_KpnM_BIS47 TaxID=1907784 RepID=A0A1V0E709_9CAUD|nr:hypothetical protein BIS47_178 [Klebsiella phage vB_KpnM_BIS47]ARB12682.1 hypothetical protein BIS47_178 [Klebsiella phage vB_KpnM_BIS47]
MLGPLKNGCDDQTLLCGTHHCLGGLARWWGIVIIVVSE